MTTQLPGLGTVLGGDFRLERQLGAGGMGAVYVAEQLSTGRKRALKLMHPSLVGDAKLRERFEQEARVGSRIPSDHVVQVIAAGVDEPTGAPFIAMELLEGEDLASTIAQRGALPAADVQAILQPVCHALGAAHKAGIVHRDLKPENIFLQHTRDVQRSFDVKLLDFGIAKLSADARTMATSSVGTPLWMAPEQTDPRAKIAPAADVWPLGLLAFTMLTGKSYWRVATERSASMQALMREILFESVDAPSIRAAELQIDVPLPIGFDAWFLRCLDREPSQRFATANEAWDALAPLLGAERRAPTQLASLTTSTTSIAERIRLESSATEVVQTNNTASAAAGTSSTAGTKANAEYIGVAATAGQSTGLSVGQTVAGSTPPQRSMVRIFGLVALVALVGVGSWQIATSRAKQEQHALRERDETSEKKPDPRLEIHAPSGGGNKPAEQAQAPDVRPDAPLSSPSVNSVASNNEAANAQEPPKSKLLAFDSEAARRALEARAATVPNRCRQITEPGPRTYVVTVLFAPDGRALSVHSNTRTTTPTVACGLKAFLGIKATPFDPASGNGSVSVPVSVD